MVSGTQALVLSANATGVGKGGSVIVVEAKYEYKSLFGSYVPGFKATMPWTDKSYHSPRNACVDYVEGDNCTNSC